MRRRILALFTVILMCLSPMLHVGAQDTMIPYASEFPEERLKPRVVDDADILSSDELSALQNMLDEISERNACDVIIAIAKSLEGMSAQSFSDDYYDYNGFGMGSDFAGIVFLISMDEREWAFSTYGYGVDAFTDATLEYMEEQIIPYLSDGDYYGAFAAYAQEADEALVHARILETDETLSDGEHPYYEEDDENLLLGIIIMVLGLAVISIVIGTLLAYIQKRRAVKHYSGVIQDQRAVTKSYVSNMKLTKDEKIPMGRGVQRIHSPIKKEDHDVKVQHSHVGSSTVHRSSSGRSHGGRSGKF